MRLNDSSIPEQITVWVKKLQYTGKSAFLFLTYDRIPHDLPNYFYVVGDLNNEKVWTLSNFPNTVLQHESQLEPFCGYKQLFIVERENKSGGALTSIAAKILLTKKVFLDNFSIYIGKLDTMLVLSAIPHVNAPLAARLFLLELGWMLSYQFGTGSSFEYQSVTNLLAKYKR